MSKLQDKLSALKKNHPAVQKIKLFSMFVGHFCPPGSGYRDLHESGYGSGYTALVI
jgi:hypothetical protein